VTRTNVQREAHPDASRGTRRVVYDAAVREVPRRAFCGLGRAHLRYYYAYGVRDAGRFVARGIRALDVCAAATTFQLPTCVRDVRIRFSVVRFSFRGDKPVTNEKNAAYAKPGVFCLVVAANTRTRTECTRRSSCRAGRCVPKRV